MRDAKPDESSFLAIHGYVHIPGLLALSEVEELRDALHGARLERGERLPDSTCFFPYDDGFERVFEQLTNVWQTHIAVARFTLGAGVARFMTSLIGASDWRLYRDHSLLKRAGASPTPLHVDGELWSFDAEGLSVWIALDSATPHSGAMLYRSNRTSEVVTCAAEVGDAYVHRSSTVHGACANTTGWPRQAYVVSCMPDGVRFNGRPNVLPKRLLEDLKVGDPLVDKSFFPTLGSKAPTHAGR